MTSTFRLGTRSTPLALEQSRIVGARLERAGIDVVLVPVSTSGDRSLGGVLAQGKGVFTAELSECLHSGEIDGAVHSLKDLPVEGEADLTIVAIPERAAANDLVIVGADHAGESFQPLLELLQHSECSSDPIHALSPNGKLGTSSPRRQSAALAQRPDLLCVAVRGAVGTRLATLRAGTVEALILAEAGLQRLADSADTETRPNGLASLRAARLDLESWPCAPGQGALALQVAVHSPWSTHPALLDIDHEPTRRAVTLERNALASLGGGCQQPFAAWSPDGSRCVLSLSPTSWRARAAVAKAPHRVIVDRDESLAGLSDLVAEIESTARSVGGIQSPDSDPEPDLVVTTTRLRAERLLAKLPAAVHTLALPVTRPVVLDVSWPSDVLDFSRPRRDWPCLLVSSPNAARIIVDRCRIEPQWGTIAWCALGDGTARELLGAGYPPSMVASVRDGEEFADFVAATIPAQRPLIIPHSARSSGAAVRRLRAAGRQVVDFPAYTVVSEKLSDWPWPIRGRPRSLLLVAPSQVAAIVDNQLELPANCLTLGSTTARALQEAADSGAVKMTGPLRIRIAERPDAASIAALWNDSEHPTNDTDRKPGSQP